MAGISKNVLIAYVVSCAAYPILAQTVEGWNLTIGDKGAITSMRLSNPQTYLKIEDIVTIRLNEQGILPREGAVRFNNGFERALTRGEVSLYWDSFKGERALWSHLASQGKLKNLNPQTTSLPDSWLEKKTRALTHNNIELFGTLSASPKVKDGFILQIEGASGGPVNLDTKAVTLLQQIK